jgi:hypothetical protein
MRLAATILASILSAACAPTDAPAPSFPSAGSVAELAIRSGATISEPNQVSEFIVALGHLNHGWHYPFDTYPTPQASIVFMNTKAQPLCSVYLGPNWLGSNCVQQREGTMPLIRLTNEQANYFRNFVGGTWEVK